MSIQVSSCAEARGIAAEDGASFVASQLFIRRLDIQSFCFSTCQIEHQIAMVGVMVNQPPLLVNVDLVLSSKR